MSIKNLMFLGINIPKEVQSIMKHIEETDGVEKNIYYNNELTAKAWNAEVRFVMDILNQVCNTDDYHVIVHIPDLKEAEEFTYSDFKKLDYIKSCIKENEEYQYI